MAAISIRYFNYLRGGKLVKLQNIGNKTIAPIVEVYSLVYGGVGN